MNPHIILTSPGSGGHSACNGVANVVRDSLAAHGVQVQLFDGPDAHRDTVGFLRKLHKFISARRADDANPIVLLPIFFPEVLAEHRDEFPECLIPLDSAEKIKLLDNKLTACHLAERLGIPQPCRYTTPDEITAYPVVFKRTLGQGGDSVYFPRDRKALDNLVSTAKEYLITDYIDGENWCTDCLRTVTAGGEISFRAASYRVLEPQGKGISIRREAVQAPQMEQWCRQMLDAIDYRGVCEMDFRRRADGRFFFLECNPRFSGGIETTLESGFDIVWDYLRTSLAVR